MSTVRTVTAMIDLGLSYKNTCLNYPNSQFVVVPTIAAKVKPFWNRREMCHHITGLPPGNKPITCAETMTKL